MPEDQQRIWEYVNYGLALAGLLLVFGISRQRRQARRRRNRTRLGIEAGEAA